MKFVLLAFSNYLKYLEEITNMCEEMGRLCPQYERFSKLFPTHIELQDSLCEFYSIVVDFFREALLFLYSSAFKQLAIATFKPFTDKFSKTIRLLGLASKTIEREIMYASQQEEHVERINNASARTQALDFYNTARTAFYNIDEDRVNLSDAARKSKRERILRNICDYPYYFDFTNNLHKRQEASGRWIFDTAEYKAWLDLRKSSGLWYHAIPGFGKSVLTATVVESLLEKSKTSRIRHNISYFFCSYTNAESLSARTIVSSILHQLFYYSNNLPQDLLDDLESRYKDKVSSSRVLLRDLQRFLAQILRSNNALNFIIIDGLDECNDKERGIVLRVLKQVLVDTPNTLKILVSSRSSHDIARALKDCFGQLDLATSNQQDIELFISQTLRDKETEGQLPELPQALFDKIKTFLAQNAKGLFLWVDLQITEICKEAGPADIEAALPNLPKDLDELYSRVLDRIQRHRRPEIAKRIFRWMVYAVRPLTLDELKEAIAIQDPEVSSYKLLKQRTNMDDSKWLQNCENLVVVTKGSETVQLVHSTVKGFFETSDMLQSSYFQMTPRPDHKELAELCIRYFELPEITDPPNKYQRTVIKNDAVNLSSLLAGSMAEARSSWTGWLAQKVQSLAMTSPSTSSMALVKTQGPMALVTPERTFKHMLRTHCLLGYASSNWIKHYDFSHQQSPLSSEEIEYKSIFHRLLREHESIRFAWQNFFVPGSNTSGFDNIYGLLDYALLEEVGLIFRVIVTELGFDSQNILMTYWLGVHDATKEKAEKTRFQVFCRQSDRLPDAWDSAILTLTRDIESRGITRLPRGSNLHRDPLMLSELLLWACAHADQVLFDQILDLIKKKEAVRPHDRINPSKHFEIPMYGKLIMAAIESDCFGILEALHTPQFSFMALSLPRETKFDILWMVLERVNIRLFELLRFPHHMGLSCVPDGKPSLIQRAVEIGDLDLVKLCTDDITSMFLRSDVNRLYPIQIAADRGNLEVLKHIVSLMPRDRIDVSAPGSANTALTIAIKKRDPKMVRVLLEAGADLELESNKLTINTSSRPDKWKFPMLELIHEPDPDVAEVLLEHDCEAVLSKLQKFREDPSSFEDPWQKFLQGPQHSSFTEVCQIGRYQMIEKILDAMKKSDSTRTFPKYNELTLDVLVNSRPFGLRDQHA
ncbi:hypothetical protein ABW21_db0209224 [Orbilia brochopaga]|nr:hypothetical protein ABW21_db0209224 [Drechslerella brochopaga]